MALQEELQRALGADYRIERELGGGGMSRVFVAEEVALARQVAIKVMAPDLVATLSVERFRREIQLAARLQHPNIVPVLASGEADGLPWFSMPFVAGESLRARLGREGQLALRDAVAILRDVAAALEFAHAQGIVHRDIKPDNVLLAGRAAVVTDFGIAKAISAARTVAPGGTLTQVGTSLGTPAYMSPEQAAGDPTTGPRADLYGWGVMAFELLAGRLPFASTSAHELVRAHMVEAPPRLDALRPGLSAALVALVDQCLAKRPEDRPADAAQLLRVLEGIPLSGAPGTGAAPSVAPAARRGRWLAAALLVLVVAGGAVVALRGTGGSAASTAAAPTPPAFDPALVLLVPPTAADPSLASAASLTTDALSRALGGMRYAQVTVAAPGAGDRRAEAAAGHIATILDGRLYAAGDSLQLDLRLTDAASGRVLRALPPVRVPRADPGRGLDAALEPVASAVAIIAHPLLGAPALPVGPLPRIAAVRAVEQALLATEFAQVIRGLDEAVAADAGWTLTPILRAVRYLWSSRYYEDPARRRAYLAALPAEGTPLSPYEAALRSAVVAEAGAMPERELEALRRLAEVAPSAFGASDYIESLLASNRPREALAQLERAGPWHRDPTSAAGAPLTERAGYWLQLAELRHYTGDHANERIAAERYAKLGTSAVIGLIRRGVAYAALGDSAAVEAVVEAAEVVPSEVTPNYFGGEVQLVVAQELVAHGHEAHGRQVLARAISWIERHRSERWAGDSVPRSDIGLRYPIALHAAGRDSEALAEARPLLARPTTDPRFRSFYGRVQGVLGNQAAADSVDAWLAELQQDPARAGTALNERAFLAAARGRKADAVAFLRESFARGNTFYIRRNVHRFNDWWTLKGYAPFDKIVTPEG